MNIGTIGLVFRKELRETLRDRRTLLVMVVVPIFLYPILLIVLQQLAIFGQRQMQEAPATVIAQGADREAAAVLAAEAEIELSVEDDVDPRWVTSGDAELVVRFHPPGPDSARAVTLFFDAANDRSNRARDLVGERLTAWNDSLLANRLAERGLPASFARPLAVADSSVASAEQLGGYALGRFLPMLLILMTLLGAFYPAIDLSAGEKERGTLEPLLTAPVPPGEVVAGKFLTVTLVAVAAATLNLASMLLTFQYAAFQLGGAVDVQFTLPVTTIVLVILLLIPLAVLFAAIFLGIALRAQSFKEAQNSLTPVQLASMVPMALPLIPGIDLSYLLAVVPVGGVALLFRELMIGAAPVGPAVVALVATVAYAVLALRFAARSFGREEVLFGVGSDAAPRPFRERLAEWRASSRSVPRPFEALALVAVAGLLYFYFGVLLQIRFGEIGLLVSQFAFLALPAILIVWLGPFDARETLALRRPSARGLFAALLIILGGIPVGWMLAWVQSLFLEVPEAFLTALEELIRAGSTPEVLWLLLLVGVTPAICEELVFRGVLVQGLASRMNGVRAVLISAAVFGAFHLSTETVIRFLPSAWLGVLLGLVAWRTRSLYASALMHFVNNGLIVMLVANPQWGEWVVPDGSRPRPELIVAGVIVLAIGYLLLPRRSPAEASVSD